MSHLYGQTHSISILPHLQVSINSTYSLHNIDIDKKKTLNFHSVNLVMFSHGATNGWMSPAVPILSSNDTPLESGPLTNEDISWIGSINAFGAICGTIALGYFISLMGTKRAILLLAIPEDLFWIFIYFGTHYYYILIARVLIGISGGGILTSLVLFIAEIANDK